MFALIWLETPEPCGWVLGMGLSCGIPCVGLVGAKLWADSVEAECSGVPSRAVYCDAHFVVAAPDSPLTAKLRELVGEG